MTHWSDRYIGRRYVRGVYDCAHLLVEVMAEQFGRAVSLPAHASGVRDRDKQIATLTATLCRPLAGTEAAGDGDVALMRAAGRRVSLGHHCGIVFILDNERHVLHCLAGLGVIRHPLRDLGPRCLELTGVYRWT